MVDEMGIDSLKIAGLGVALKTMLSARVRLHAVKLETEAAEQHVIVRTLWDHVDALMVATR